MDFDGDRNDMDFDGDRNEYTIKSDGCSTGPAHPYAAVDPSVQLLRAMSAWRTALRRASNISFVSSKTFCSHWRDDMHSDSEADGRYGGGNEMVRDTAFIIKDSGVRATFDSGMVRDTADDKTDFELPFNGPMFDRWARHLTTGAKKYPDVALGVPNWTLAAGEEEKVRFRKSAVRHFRQWLRGDTDEDHAAAVYFNINGVEYVKGRQA